jgi:hypothetical protein
MPHTKKTDRQDRLGGVQAGVHHDNVKAPVDRLQNEKAAKEIELQGARSAEAVAAQELSRANRGSEDGRIVLAKKEGEIQALEVASRGAGMHPFGRKKRSDYPNGSPSRSAGKN